MKPLLFFSAVSILVFFHLWSRTCSINTPFKLISFLRNYKAYWILSPPCKKGVIAICIEKYQHVKIWWWQADSAHQNFVTFSVVRTDFFTEQQHFSHFYNEMKWVKRVSILLNCSITAIRIHCFHPNKKFTTQQYQQFFLLQGTSINFTKDLFSKVSRMVLGHIKPPTQWLLGDISH